MLTVSVPSVYLVAGGGITLVIVLLILFVLHTQSAECPADFLLHSRSSLEGEPWWERAAVARRMSIDSNTCRVCQKPTTTQCGHCKSVKYCGQVCQRKDWGSGHKFECQNLKNLKQHAAKAAAAGGLSKPPFLDPNEDAPVPQQVLCPYPLYLQLRKSTHSCRRPPVGLTNHGNNCYANAALQCLLYTKPLRAFLDQGVHTSSCNRPHDRDWCLLCVLTRLCQELADAPLHAEMSLKPLLRHLRRFAKTMSYGRQEDAHEFFYSVLNTMEAIQLTNFGGKERYDMRTQETTLVHHVFGGYLRSQVVCCGCGAASRRYEVALDLQLEVPHGVDRLEDVLQRHTADEVLDGDNCYACDGCKQRCRATRSTRFEVAPNTLVLCLKRFGTGRFGKINKVLVYGEKLDLGPFMARGAMDEGPATYTLTGVVVHLDQMNSTSFGHYISFVRTCDGNGSSSHGQWYACDDSRVCRTRASDVLSQNAYMLFYQRDIPKPTPSPAYKRPKPLLPLTAAQQAAAAAAAAAAEAAAASAAPSTPKGQEGLTKASNGVAAAAAAAGAVEEQHAALDTQQLDQKQQVARQAAAGQVHQQQQQQPSMVEQQQRQSESKQQQQPLLTAMRSQPPPAEPDATELLPRIATAPAALALLAGREGGSSSRDDDEECASHATTSSCLADVSECSTPSYQANGAASDSSWQPSHSRSNSGSSSSTRPPAQQEQQQQQPEAAAGEARGAAAGQVPQHTLLRQRRQQRQQQQQQQDVSGSSSSSTQNRRAPVPSSAAAAAAAGLGGGPGLASSSTTNNNTSSSSRRLPNMQPRITRAGPELLRLIVDLPGVSKAAEVQVAVESSAQQPEQQCLWLQVPGRFAELHLPLAAHLHPGQTVCGVSGRFYRTKQQLKLKLRLGAAAAAAAGGDGGDVVDSKASAAASAASAAQVGLNGSEQQQQQVLEYHLTDSFDTSSGSESEGFQPATRRGMHPVASERDLCSIFGRHSSTVAHQLMQQLQQQRALDGGPPGGGQQQQQEADAGTNGTNGTTGSGGGKKSAGKKKAAGKKKKRK